MYFKIGRFTVVSHEFIAWSYGTVAGHPLSREEENFQGSSQHSGLGQGGIEGGHICYMVRMLL
jgi:hypothetical protein